MRAPCPCGSKKMYMRCCRPLLAGKVIPDTAQALMRSRYTAFAKGKWQYLSETEAGKAAEGGRDGRVDGVRWLGLEIHEVIQGGINDNSGAVVFTAHYAHVGDGRRFSMHEHSIFEKINGRWYYIDSIASP